MDRRMRNTYCALCWSALLWLWWACGVYGYGQLTLTDIALVGQVVEPSGGDYQVVFSFTMEDRDPLSNDASGIQVQCILIQNLGTATMLDIPSVILQGPDVQSPSAVFTMVPPVGAPPASCPPGAGAGGNVAFEAFIGKTELDLMGFGGDPDDVADDGSLTLQVAVQVADSSTLLSGSQNHTLKLRVSIQFQETVGSPPLLTTFSDSITDVQLDRVSNSGINELRIVNFLNNTIRIGQAGLVGRFEVCDQDANSLDLSVDTVRIVQDNGGDALHSDIQMLTVEAVGIASYNLIPSTEFNQGGAGENLHIHTPIPDEQCQVFDVKVTISAAAQRGRKIQLQIVLFTREPASIHPSVAPLLKIPQSVLIGSGILSIPDTYIANSSVAVNLDDFPLPGLGQLDVQTQPMQFDPSVISVDSMEAQPPYQLESFSVDNRAGLLRFTLKLDSTQTSSAKTQGTIAYIHMSRRGQAGESTLLLFQVDRVLDANNVDVTAGIMVVSGFVTLLAPGDVDFDGVPTVRDALIVANAILPCTTNADSPIPDLTDEQKRSADVAPIQADAGLIPSCTELNSGDVREIARLAITIGISGEPGFVAEPAQQAVPPDKPWWQRWFEQIFQPRQDPAAQATLLTTDAGTWQLLLDSQRPVVAVQGRIRFDPRSGQVEGVGGLDGQLLAYEVDSRHGMVRFAALVAGAPRHRAAILEVRWRGEPSARPQLELEYVLGRHAENLPYVMTQPPSGHFARLAVAGLRLNAWDGAHGKLEVLGQGVAHTTIAGFDLAGRRRFTAESAGNALSWAMLDGQGHPLANGVYLFVVTVRGFSGEVWRSEVRKLVWLR